MNKHNFPWGTLLVIGILIVCAFAAGIWVNSDAAKQNYLPNPKTVLAGSGTVVREDRDVSGMNGTIQLDAPGELIITTGAENQLTVEAEDLFLGIIQTRLENGTLIIVLTLDPDVSLQMSHPIQYLLTVKDIHAIKLSGSASVEALDIETDDLKVVLNGGGKMHLAGHADTQSVEINGSGIYQAEDLKSQSISLKGKGVLDATVWVTEQFDAACNGACSIKYYGNPELRKNISVVGTVTKLGDK